MSTTNEIDDKYMCKRHFTKQKGACGHSLVIDGPGNLVPSDGCKGCGIEKGTTANIATGTSRMPCDDCKFNGN